MSRPEATIAHWDAKLTEEDEEFTESIQSVADLQRGVRTEIDQLGDTKVAWQRALDSMETERALLQEIVDRLAREVQANQQSNTTAKSQSPGRSPASSGLQPRRPGYLDKALRGADLSSYNESAEAAAVVMKKCIAAIKPKKSKLSTAGKDSPSTTDGESPPTMSPVVVSPQSELSTLASHLRRLRRIKAIRIVASPQEQQGPAQAKAKAEGSIAKKAGKFLLKKKKGKGDSGPSGETTQASVHSDPCGAAENAPPPLPEENPQLSVKASVGFALEPHATPIAVPAGGAILGAVTLRLTGRVQSIESRLANVADESTAALRAELKEAAAKAESEASRDLIGRCGKALVVSVSNGVRESSATDPSESLVGHHVAVLVQDVSLVRELAMSDDAQVLELVSIVAQRLIEVVQDAASSAEGQRQRSASRRKNASTAARPLIGDPEVWEQVRSLLEIFREKGVEPHDLFLLMYSLALQDASLTADLSVDSVLHDGNASASSLLWRLFADPWLQFFDVSNCEALGPGPLPRVPLGAASVSIERFPNDLLQATNKVLNETKRKLPAGMPQGMVSAKTKISLGLSVYDELHCDLYRPYVGPTDQLPNLDPFAAYACKELHERSVHIRESLKQRNSSLSTAIDTAGDELTAKLETSILRATDAVREAEAEEGTEEEEGKQSTDLTEEELEERRKSQQASIKDAVENAYHDQLREVLFAAAEVHLTLAVPSLFVALSGESPFPDLIYATASVKKRGEVFHGPQP